MSSGLISEWLCGLGEMTTVKCRATDSHHSVPRGPTGTISFPNRVRAPLDLSQIHARLAGAWLTVPPALGLPLPCCSSERENRTTHFCYSFPAEFSIMYNLIMAAGSSNKLQNRYLDILNGIPFLKLSHRAGKWKRLR